MVMTPPLFTYDPLLGTAISAGSVTLTYSWSFVGNPRFVTPSLMEPAVVDIYNLRYLNIEKNPL